MPVVAEPSAAVLLLAGLALMAGRRRRIARQAIYDIAARRAA
ncbi:PEP-CTERM sorting domain-containing protein [Massilia sp. NP310]|nr:PEP-CTERM sorting domain-containing protein [Massilia sp. NP310]